MAVSKTINRNEFIEYTTSEVVFSNKSTKEEIYMDALTSDALEKKVEELEFKAGINNDTIMKIDKKVDYTFQAVSATSNESMVGSKLGAVEKATESGKLIKLTQFPVNKAIVKSGSEGSETYTITLDKTPIDETEIVLAIGDEVLTSSDYSISDKTITITKTDVGEGDMVYVSSYKYLSETGVKYYDIGATNASNSSVFEAVIRKPIYDKDNNIKYWRQIYCPKCQIDKNFKSEGKTERSQQDITYDFTILKDPNYDYVMQMCYIPAETE